MKKKFLLFIAIGSFINTYSQNNSGGINIDFDLNMQTYREDALIGAQAADEILLNNAYLNINYTKGNFTTGIRYESYLNALLSFDDGFKGNGIPYKYARYNIDGLEVTAGNYYDQIGSGLIFRAYENKRLGIDNAMDGIKIKYNLINGLSLKTFIGKSRTYFTYAEGIIRGGDAELNVNEILNLKTKTKLILGQGIVSRYQEDNNPLLSVGFYDLIVAFDKNNKKTFLLSSGLPKTFGPERVKYAKQRIDFFFKKISQVKPRQLEVYSGKWKPEISRNIAQNKIRDAINYIHEGDIFQVNITHKFKSPRPSNLNEWDLFRRLRRINPSPFGAYLSINKNFKILSCSPERFIKIDSNKMVETRPIKGSQKRDPNQEKDMILANKLMKSEKDISENLMIVDLMRNDLSRVCEVGSIKVDDLCKLESFEKIHHLVSVITGKLREDKDAVDLLRLCFPGGSVTGAPKIRAMEIINELEISSRGPYCGTIFWMGFDGKFDSSITIRSIIINFNEIVAQAGGAIVAESDPYQEYEEALFKANPLLNILE